MNYYGKIYVGSDIKEALKNGILKNGKKIINIFAGSKKYELKNSYSINLNRWVGVSYNGVIEMIAYLKNGEIPKFWNKIIIKKHRKRTRIYIIIEEKTQNDNEILLTCLKRYYKTTLRGIYPRAKIQGEYFDAPLAKINLITSCRSGRYGNITTVFLGTKEEKKEINKNKDTHEFVSEILSCL